jgi:hypothetical protein
VAERKVSEHTIRTTIGMMRSLASNLPISPFHLAAADDMEKMLKELLELRKQVGGVQPEPEHRDVVIKGDLWRIEFLPDHAASVVLVKANYEAEAVEKAMFDVWQDVGDPRFPHIKAQPEPEPVAWMHDQKVGFNVPLYTAPPQREWQGLTDEEAQWIYDNGRTPSGMMEMVEAKLKEKNT